jgi:hypothetical protein
MPICGIVVAAESTASPGHVAITQAAGECLLNALHLGDLVLRTPS